ncbi:MAG TPA: bifunctional riboflavin kinase/FAD synthetase [Gammaproteobacteria bacterium]|jgi:riboflavin kinase/FMN adenylyltransferase|nr:bifunctional riboflavin kinase/FAD synthetase [Gammaproteobacteria bacterium]
MKLIRGLCNLRAEHQGSVASIGNFDGVHLGHQTVVKQALTQADKLQTQSTAITFDPSPNEYFRKESAPGRLTPLCEKVALLDQLGIDQTLRLPFNTSLANMSADDFIRVVLVDGLKIKQLVVGDDFRFGKNRTGDFELLKKAGEEHGFNVVDTHTFICDDGQRVSSSRIRQALSDGDFSLAEKLLDRPFTLSGKVMHGDKRGRTIGFPTLNIRANRPISPLKGVFAVKVEGFGNGVANIGTRPTFNAKGFLAEIHLLDFSGDLYGQRITVHWLKKLRDERKFENFEALVTQIKKDIKNAENWFTKN